MPNANSSIRPTNDAEGSSRLQDHLRKNLASSDWPVQLKLAIACRKLADEGHALTLAGQVSARADEESYWTTQLASGFSHVKRSDVVRINSDLDVIEGCGIANPGVRFHLWVYKKRPDVNAIVHTPSTLLFRTLHDGREAGCCAYGCNRILCRLCLFA